MLGTLEDAGIRYVPYVPFSLTHPADIYVLAYGIITDAFVLSFSRDGSAIEEES